MQYRILIPYTHYPIPFRLVPYSAQECQRNPNYLKFINFPLSFVENKTLHKASRKHFSMRIIKSSKCKLRYAPEELQEALKKGGIKKHKAINAVIEDLCRCKYFENTIFRYVLDNGGNRTKAEEVFEEGLIKLSELLRRGQYKGGKIEAFAIQICKNIWLNMRRKKDEQLNLTDDLTTIDSADHDTPESQLAAKEKTIALQEILQNCLEGTCRKLMQMKFIEGERHEKIAETLGLANANSSKEKLNRCKKSALKCIMQREDYQELLKSVDFHVKKKTTHGK